MERGRPKAEDPRNNCVTVKYNKSELELVNKYCANHNMKRPTYIRDVSLRRRIDFPIKREMLGQIRRVGTNINQIAKVANQRGQITEFEALQERLKEFDLLLNEIKGKL